MGARLSLMAVDLDGTLLRGNSLHEYIRCGLCHGSLWQRTRLAVFLGLRRMRLVSHVWMKRRALAAIRRDESLVTDFRMHVDALRRREVQRLIDAHVASGGRVLLATAASEVYVPDIWEGDYVCTDAACDVECRGAAKVRRVLDYAAAHGCRLDIVVTDHPDDMPLLSCPGVRRIIVGGHAGLATISAERRIE